MVQETVKIRIDVDTRKASQSIADIKRQLQQLSNSNSGDGFARSLIKSLQEAQRSATDLKSSLQGALSGVDASGIQSSSRQASSALEGVSDSAKGADRAVGSIGDSPVRVDGVSALNDSLSGVSKGATNASSNLANVSSSAVKAGSGASSISQVSDSLGGVSKMASNASRSLSEAFKARGASWLSSIKDSLTSVKNEADKTSIGFKELLGANVAGSAIIGGLRSLKGALSGVFDEMQESGAAYVSFENNMAIIGKTKTQIDALKRSFQSYAQQTKFNSADMITTYSQLEMSGVSSAENVTKAIAGIASSAPDTEQAMKSLSQQIVQMAGRPTVAWEDFRIIMQQAPGAMAEVAKRMGTDLTGLSQKIRDGEVKTSDFMKAIDQVGNSAGFQKQATQVRTVNDAWNQVKETIGNALLGANDNINKFAAQASESFQRVFKNFKFDETKKALGGLSGTKIDWDSIFRRGLELFDKVAGSLIKIAPAAFKVTEAVAPIAGALADVVSSAPPEVILGIVGAFKAFSTLKGVLSFAQALGPALGGIGGSALPILGVVTAITAVVGALTYFFTQTETGRELWSQFTNWLKNTWDQIWQAWGPAITALWEAVKAAFNVAWEAIKTIFAVGLAFITGDWEGAWNQIKTFAGTVWESIKTIISSTFTIVKTFITNTLNNIKKIWSGIWNGIKSFFIGLWNGIKSAASNGANALKNGISSAVNGIKGIWTRGWNAIKSTFSNIWNGIKNMFNGAKNALVRGISNMVSSARRYFDGLRRINLFSAGSAIIRGFLNGLTSGFRSVQRFVGGIASWIKKNKGPLPYDARLLIPAGKLIMGGLLDGLEYGFKDVDNLISDIAPGIQRKLSNVDVSASISPSVSGSATMQTSHIAVIQSSFEHISNKYKEVADKAMDLVDKALDRDVSLEIDGKEFARATAKDNSEALAGYDLTSSRRR